MHNNRRIEIKSYLYLLLFTFASNYSHSDLSFNESHQATLCYNTFFSFVHTEFVQSNSLWVIKTMGPEQAVSTSKTCSFIHTEDNHVSFEFDFHVTYTDFPGHKGDMLGQVDCFTSSNYEWECGFSNVSGAHFHLYKHIVTVELGEWYWEDPVLRQTTPSIPQNNVLRSARYYLNTNF